jgi:hypothetical protein
MLELPSKGSKATTYFPYFSIGTSIGVSSSSDKRTAHLLELIKQFIKTSFEIKSNFLT